jgi:glucose-6-phosphate 1-dehydrogenase
MIGDPTLFSRTDLVETAWRIAQPLLEVWSQTPAGEFPNYPAGSWGPKAAFDLIENDGRKWFEAVNRDMLEKVPLFQTCSAVFLHSLSLILKPDVFAPGDFIIRKGDTGSEMFFIVRGEVEVMAEGDHVVTMLREGDFFGETALLRSQPRMASIRAKTHCDLYVLDKNSLNKVLKDHPQVAKLILEISKTRYQLTLGAEEAFGPHVKQLMSSV